MSPTARGIAHHCPCGLLLAVRNGGEVRIKYKASWVIVRGGSVEVRCRRCGHVVSFHGSEGPGAAA